MSVVKFEVRNVGHIVISSKNTMYGAVIFDLDGTLTDPKIGIVTCIQFALSELGYKSPPGDRLLWCIGPPLKDIFSQLIGTNDEIELGRAMSIYRDRFSNIGIFENSLYPQIPEILQEIRSAGYATYIATSKPHIYATRIVEHFQIARLFNRVYGSELDGTRSNKGDLIRHILQLENLPTDRTIMVGDRYYDTMGAKQNGLYSIGVTYGYGTETELRNCGTDAIVNSFTNILETIHKYNDFRTKNNL